jgi:uncharacterized protein
VTEQEILDLIKQDKWMMRIILIASSLSLPDWIIGAGFVRNKVWDHLSGNEKQTVDTRDIDLVYFDSNGNDEKSDEKLSEEMKIKTGIEWEIVNEYYAHKWNNLPPYTSTEDAISKWPETVTAIGVTMDKNNELKLFAPYGIGDLVNFVVRPSPKFKGGIDKVKERVIKKKWKEKWPNITLAI